MQYQSNNQITSAEETYLQVLESPLLSSLNPSKGVTQPAVFLKYLVLKNLASIYEGNPLTQDKAAEFYLKALHIDDTDVVLWYHLGQIALQLSNYWLARRALEKAVLIQPSHWLSLDKLIEVRANSILFTLHRLCIL